MRLSRYAFTSLAVNFSALLRKVTWLPRRHDLPWSRIKLFLWWVMWVHLAGISCLATCDVNFMDFSATFRMRLKPIYSTVFFCFEDAESYIYMMSFSWSGVLWICDYYCNYYIIFVVLYSYMCCCVSNPSSTNSSSLPSLRSFTVIRFSVQRNLTKLNLLIEFNEKFEDC